MLLGKLAVDDHLRGNTGVIGVPEARGVEPTHPLQRTTMSCSVFTSHGRCAAVR